MIFVITNRKLCPDDFLNRIRLVASGHPSGIILREKDLSHTEYAMLAQDCRDICSEYQIPFIVNSHIAVAERLEIPSIQLSFSSLTAHHDRLKLFLQVGVSVHSLAEAQVAEQMGVDYLIAGHIFETSCKESIQPRGIQYLKEICKKVSIPVYSIGGINESRVADVIRAGSSGVCVMSQLMTCSRPDEKVKAYQRLTGGTC